MEGYILLCPNLVGSLEAPTTAKLGEEKNVRTAASVAILNSDLLIVREIYIIQARSCGTEP